jgi:cell division protein FtsQ
MARKKSDGLTPRQRQSQQIMRDKSARKKRKALVRKCAMVGGGLACALVTAAGVWAWQTSAFSRATEAVENGAYGLTLKAGFSLQNMYLEGRNRTSMADIEKALNVKIGDPIFKPSLQDMRERLEKVGSIQFAAVERALPSTMYVRIVEREPVALWQNNARITLVDDNGVAMDDLDIAPHKHLPLIIGESAPKHVRELMAIMAAEPELAKRFASATRVSDRRWNIRLQNGHGDKVEVRLPEANAIAAWKRLAEMELKQRLLEREVRVIDLRLDGKVFIKLSPDVFTDKTESARET